MLGAARAGATRQPSSCLPMPGTYAGTLPGLIDGVNGPISRESRSASPTRLRGGSFWRCSLSTNTWAKNGDQTITLKSKFGGETICMTAMQIYGGTKYIKGESCGPDLVTKFQQFNLIPTSTPAPAPTPSPATYDCPWSPKRQGKDKPCMTDAQCNGAWLGPGAHMCSKCHNSVVGARAICGPQ